MSTAKKVTLFMACMILVVSLRPALAVEPITLKFATQNPENAFSTVNGLIPYLKKIEAESKGTLKIDLYANQTLTKGPQVWMAVKNGIADMAWIPMAMYPGSNPLLDVVGMAGLPADDAMKRTTSLWNAFEQVEAMRTPLAGNKIVALYTTDTSFLCTKKPVRTIENLKGMKIRCTAGAFLEWLTALGASPVVMAMPEVYMSLQKGIIDGVLCDWESLHGFRFYEEAKNITANIPIGAVAFCVAMNENRFQSLPPDAKKAIEQNSGRAGSMWLAENFSYKCRVLGDEIKNKNLANYTELSPEEKARWTEFVSKPLWDKWLDTVAKKGVSDGPKTLEIMKAK